MYEIIWAIDSDGKDFFIEAPPSIIGFKFELAHLMSGMIEEFLFVGHVTIDDDCAVLFYEGGKLK